MMAKPINHRITKESKVDVKHLLGEFKSSDIGMCLYELAKEYHEKTEEYDRTVCSVRNERGIAMPANGYELSLINRNAYAVRERILKENPNITSRQLHGAITSYTRRVRC